MQTPDIYLFKGKVLKIDNYELLVKYARPLFGWINQGLQIKIDTTVPRSV